MRRNHLAALDDAALVARTRDGDLDAFGVLWERHRGAVTRAARSFTGYDADDVTAEAFARVLRQVRAGGGPDSEPRAYLVRTARNVATEWARRDGGAALAPLDEEAAGATDDHADAVDRRAAARAAYERLPERWRQALWYRDVEDLPVAECARILGATPNSTTVMLRRAREGFAQEWIRENLERRGASDECAWVTGRLPRHARGKTTPGDARRITAHLAACADCTLGAAEARHLDGRLAVLLLPALLGSELLRQTLTADPAPSASATAASTGGSAAGSAPGSAGPRLAAVPASRGVARLLPATAAGRWALAGGAAALVAAITVTVLVWPRPDVAPAPPVDAIVPSPAPEPTPDAEPTPTATPAPVASATPASPAAPPPPATASPTPAPVAERAITIDAVPSTPGLYPAISGRATPGAAITVVFTGPGGSAALTTTAKSNGRWSVTPNIFSGTIAFEATQRYRNAAGATVEQSAAGSFTVTPTVDVVVTATGDTTSTVVVTGPAGATVDVSSTVEPALSGTYTVGGDGQVLIPSALPKGDQAPVRVRLVAGSATGPWVVWG